MRPSLPLPLLCVAALVGAGCPFATGSASGSGSGSASPPSGNACDTATCPSNLVCQAMPPPSTRYTCVCPPGMSTGYDAQGHVICIVQTCTPNPCGDYWCTSLPPPRGHACCFPGLVYRNGSCQRMPPAPTESTTSSTNVPTTPASTSQSTPMSTRATPGHPNPTVNSTTTTNAPPSRPCVNTNDTAITQAQCLAWGSQCVWIDNACLPVSPTTTQSPTSKGPGHLPGPTLPPSDSTTNSTQAPAGGVVGAPTPVSPTQVTPPTAPTPSLPPSTTVAPTAMPTLAVPSTSSHPSESTLAGWEIAVVVVGGVVLLSVLYAIARHMRLRHGAASSQHVIMSNLSYEVDDDEEMSGL